MSNNKYISLFPKPFLEDLVKGRVLPIIGAGFSKNAQIPKGKNIPDWEELGKTFADLIPDYNYNGAIDAISAYEHEYSRAKLIEKLSDLLLTGQLKAGNTHKSFCSLPFQSVATTNFDFLLEEGYGLVSRYCRPIIEEEQLSIANGNPKDIALFKIHGDLHHPKRIVATEEDYDGFLNRYPMISTFLANLFISKTILFIGYSLDDPDLRQVYQLIKDRLGNLKRQAYTLRINSTPQEITRFERRGVKVINIPKGTKSYSQVLEDVFEELRDYWTKEYPNIATITEEDPLIELTMEKESSETSRLCYFSVPYSALSLYKKYIFPIAETYGFAPITADDVLTQGNNIAAKISALIERSSVVVIDISNQTSLFELGIVKSIQAKKKKIKTILISEEGSSIPNEFSNEYYLIRPNNIFENIDDFTIPLEKAFSQLYQELQAGFEDEPQRLISKKEYRAAVISAVTLLETQLRSKIEKKIDLRFKPYSMRQLLELAFKEELINKTHYKDLIDWVMVRNKLVHTQGHIDGRPAKRIVTSINEVLNELKMK